MKKELEKDDEYQSFIQKCNQTRQQLQQTNNSYLMPPAQRSKSRYLNLDELIEWGRNIRKYISIKTDVSNFKTETILREKKRLEKLSWVMEYQKSLDKWSKMLLITRTIEKRVKTEGLTEKLLEEYRQNYQHLEKRERETILITQIEEYLVEEMDKIKDNESRIISSDVIESLFGKYKLFSQKGPLKEIRRMILTIPLSTIKITNDLVKKGLSMIKRVDVEKWEQEIFGCSILAKRKMAFNFGDQAVDIP